MNRGKILIVDDDPDMRYGVNVRLRASDFETAYAADGISVISEALKQEPDLILLDLGLPAGDGFVVLDWLQNHAQLSSVPVVVVTAREAESFKELALAAGARDFLQKPVNNEELLDTIEKHIPQLS